MKKPNWRPVPQDDDVPPFEPTGRVQRKSPPEKPAAKAASRVQRKSPDAKPTGRVQRKALAAKPDAKPSSRKPVRDNSEPELIVLHESETGKTRHVLYVSEFEGRQLISVRQQYKDKETGEWRFGKNGVSIPFERSVLVRMARGAKHIAESLDDK